MTSIRRATESESENIVKLDLSSIPDYVREEFAIPRAVRNFLRQPEDRVLGCKESAKKAATSKLLEKGFTSGQKMCCYHFTRHTSQKLRTV